jgi:hypothetical protein
MASSSASLMHLQMNLFVSTVENSTSIDIRLNEIKGGAANGRKSKSFLWHIK